MPKSQSLRAALLLLASLAFQDSAWAATKSCGTPGNPAACPAAPPLTTPYQFYYTGSFGFLNAGPLDSVGDLNNHFAQTWAAANSGCSATTNSVTPNGPPTLHFGIPYRQYFLRNLTLANGGGSPCNPPFTTNTADTEGVRGVFCPTSTGSIVYQASPLVGPYCPMPTPAQPTSPAPLKILGACCGTGAGAASAGSGATVQGNPSDVSHGNKYQAETDYVGAGSNPLRFVRGYNSLAAYLAPSYAGLPQPLGTGWMATYFQTLMPISVPEASSTRTSVYALRPDGRVLTFSLYLGLYTPDADVVETLVATAGGYELRTANDTVEAYDTAGKLLSITPRSGVPVTVNYTGDSVFPASVSDAQGHTLNFTYAVGVGTRTYKLQSVTDPAGGVISYNYNSSNNLISVTYPGGSTRGYSYGATGGTNSLTQLTDESSVAFATWTYAPGGSQVIGSSHAGGVESYTFSYPGGAAYRTVTDPLGVTRNYNQQLVQNSYRMTGATQFCAGCDKARTYDANGNVATRTDFNNVVSTYSYDTDRNLETSRTEASGTAKARTITTAWHTTFRLPTSITETSRTTSFTHDASGNILTRTVTDTSVTPNVARTWTYTYNSFGQVLTADGPRTDVSDVTTYTYYTCTTGYQCGQLNTITNALGHVTTYNSYNAHGQPTQITDANGLVTSLAYDARRRLTDRCTGGTLPTCSGGELTHLDYWPTGLLKKVTNPDGSFIEYTYDGAHRLTQIKDGALNKIVYTLDNASNRTAENIYDPSSALRRTHTRVFNTLNQLWKDVNAAGTAAVTTTFGYDNNGNQSTVSAPLSRNSTSLYDELNRLKQITDPASGVTLFGYDANDNLTSVTDPRTLVTSYTYSGFGDLKSQTSPDTGVTTNTYDSSGNLDTSTDSRGAVTDYDYDAVNRVTSASFTLGGVTDQTIAYAYDTGTNQKGHVTGASDASHSLAWSYDTHGRITGRGQTVGAVTLSLGYGYNAAGQLASTVLPSGATITYGYNTNGQVTSLTLNGSTTILSAITYDPFGPITSWTWGNGSAANRAFDTDGKVTQVDNANGTSLKNYSYDDAFRITGIADAGNSSLSWTYGYDALDRLNAASKTGTTLGWTYDANGNRLTETGTTPSTYTNSGTSNRISSITGSLPRTYAYDSAGNTLSYAGTSFTYSNRGRMATATNGGVTATYTYNALGQRIKGTASSVTTLYTYDEAGHLAGEYTGAGVLIQETVWLGDTPVATLRPNGSGGVILYYVHADHLNSPRLVTDTSNNIRWSWESDPFGTTIPNENPSGFGLFAYNIRFPGQQYDAVIGLHYNYFRDYDPAAGRYVESDPIGLSGGINTFGYVNANPVALFDPTGLAPGYPGDVGRAMQERSCAQNAFWRNYTDMREANWKQSDKYFHCKANCQATRCGPAGFDEACRISDGREKVDQFFGDPPSASAADQKANKYGRDNSGKNPNVTCSVVCSRYRPNGLPSQY